MAVPQLGTPRKRPAHSAASHCLGCSSEPAPPKLPISPPLTMCRQDDERTEHSGNAPAAGVKYAINYWIRAGSVSSLGLG